ncbi:hypothetical protein SO802_022889 [Lithocarpus litseifolius]|uniref:Transmembrane protein n=1 Tax=Lithocarpus litseifolius TaxID=425828 RepID=A0AAW2C4P6_9ROSI
MERILSPPNPYSDPCFHGLQTLVLHHLLLNVLFLFLFLFSSSMGFPLRFYVFSINSSFVSSFDLESHVWSNLQTLKPPGVSFSFLISCKDRLVLAGIVWWRQVQVEESNPIAFHLLISFTKSLAYVPQFRCIAFFEVVVEMLKLKPMFGDSSFPFLYLISAYLFRLVNLQCIWKPHKDILKLYDQF